MNKELRRVLKVEDNGMNNSLKNKILMRTYYKVNDKTASLNQFRINLRKESFNDLIQQGWRGKRVYRVKKTDERGHEV